MIPRRWYISTLWAAGGTLPTGRLGREHRLCRHVVASESHKGAALPWGPCLNARFSAGGLLCVHRVVNVTILIFTPLCAQSCKCGRTHIHAGLLSRLGNCIVFACTCILLQLRVCVHNSMSVAVVQLLGWSYTFIHAAAYRL